MLKAIILKSITIALFVIFLLIPVQFLYAGYDDFTVNVPNGQGGYTALVIKKSGDGYVGPQGEYYPQFPSVAQLQGIYRLGSPNPSVVPVSYVQPQVQSVATYQVINQAPYEERHEDYDERPIIGSNIAEIIAPSGYKEDRDEGTFFDFKKKKKSKQAQPNNQNTTKSTSPAVENKPPVPKQSQAANNPPQDLNKAQASQKQKVDNKTSQGDKALPSK